MKIYEVISEMPAMTLHGPDGFGLTQYSGEEYVLVGGFRDGSSNAGELRLKYQIFSHELIKANDGDFQKGEIGHVVMRVASEGENQGDILGLIDIELKPKYRKSGHGKKIVRDIVDTTKSGELDIHDIQKKAKKFWDKAGVEYKGSPADPGNYSSLNRDGKITKTNEESITEAFDNPYPYTWDSTQDRYAEFGNDSFLAKAEMDMGELMVMFTLGKPGVSWTIDFAVDGAMDKTGDGDQFRTFATVVAVIKDWMANKVDLSKVTQIDFSSDKGEAAEDSRSKLYKRFGKQLASKLGWNLEVKDRGQFADFKIKNPNAPIEEATKSGSLTAQQMWDKLSKEMQGTHTGASDSNSDWSKYVLSHKGFTLKDIQVDKIPTAVKSDGMSQANIEKYKQADTSKFPPVVIGNNGYLLDGNHRLQAYKHQGIKTIKAYIGEAVNEDEDTLELPDINVGDEVRVGKFKNRKAEVKGFKTDKNGHPVLKTNKGDQQVFKPRITKLLPGEDK